MDWPYIHTLINHFPIILSVVGTAVLIAALIWRRRGLFTYALATLTLGGLAIYPADFTGDQASDVMLHKWYVVPAMIREHDDAATWALISMLVTGALAAYLWWRMLKREGRDELPPVWARVTMMIIAAWSLSVITRVAYLGGQIVHESPRLASPPPGWVAPPDSGGPQRAP